MPLLDHFRPPLSTRRHWHSFHNSWATYLAADLNRQLPAGYFAEANVQFGGVADQVEVLVYPPDDSRNPIGVVRFVTPSNKDRAANRAAFTLKCVACLQQQVGLLIVDIVTEPTGSLHVGLLSQLRIVEVDQTETGLYAATYSPFSRPFYVPPEQSDEPILGWTVEELAVGRPLPSLPFWLRGCLPLQVNLEESYTRTCEEQRIPPNGA